jgi:hypothetical protein
MLKRSNPNRRSLLVRSNLRLARSKWGRHLGVALERALAVSSQELRVSVESGDLLLIEGKWYVTHSGLLRPGPAQEMFWHSGRHGARIL